jgi:uracil-DNA glycosylase
MTIAPATNGTVIRRYQQRVHGRYAADIGLPVPYTYPDGNPIRPIPPIRTNTGGLMIVGAYPSARFESRKGVKSGKPRLVPVADNLEPFSYECYFDGQKVRTLTSGDGIRQYLLDPLGVKFEDCWITDLVKVFLYKDAHVDSCGDACPDFRVAALRGDYRKFAEKSLSCIREECELCQPKLVLTLGQEVAQAVTGGWTATADDLLNRPIERPESIGGWPTLYLPHPDACRRAERFAESKWKHVMAKRIEIARPLMSQGGRPR